MASCCSKTLWFFGVLCFIVGVVFDWFNFEELRKTDIELETTGNKACDFALDEYHWIFMTSVICKMFFGCWEYYFGYKSLSKGGEKRNTYDTLSMLFNVITSSFQAADLLLLVLFSYYCLGDEREHQVLRFLGDDKDDALASAFGTAGIIFNLAIKRNIVNIIQTFLKPCTKHDHGWLKFLSFISLLLIAACFGLAIAIFVKLDF